MSDPNVLVPDEEGVLHRAQLVALAAGEIQFNTPDNSPNVQVMGEDGELHRAQLVAMIGGGGGGSGAVDSVNGKTGHVFLKADDVGAVPQYTTMPTPSSTNLGQIAQYAGETIPTIKTSTVIAQTVGSGLYNLSVNTNTFIEAEQPSGSETVSFVASVSPEVLTYTQENGWAFDLVVDGVIQEIKNAGAEYYVNDFSYGQIDYQQDNNEYVLWLYDSQNRATGIYITNQINVYQIGSGTTLGTVTDIAFSSASWTKDDTPVNLASYGISYTGDLQDGDTIAVTYTQGQEGITQGFFYQVQSKYGPSTATISQTVGSGLSNITLDLATFEAAEQPTENTEVDFVASVSPERTVYTTVVGDITITGDIDAFVRDYITSEGAAQLNDGFGCIQYDGENASNIRLWTIGPQFSSGWTQVEETILNTYGITITGTPQYGDYVNYQYILRTEVWLKDNNPIILGNYGINYDGSPNDGDTITVNYSVPQIVGYKWEQINVQPGGGGDSIDWATTVDLPAGSGLGWSAYPVYTIKGGLPEGEYEFYWQIKTRPENYPEYSPVGLATYKGVFRVTGDGTTSNTIIAGWFTPIINGNWYAGSSYQNQSIGLYNLFRKDINSSDWYLYTQNTYWRTDIAAYYSDLEMPECFKITAIKNLKTGDLIIPEGSLYDPEHIPAGSSFQGSLWMPRLVQEVSIPSYHLNNSYNYSSDSQMFRIIPSYIASTATQPADASEIDLGLTTENGRFHAIIDNAYSSYKYYILEATGELANVEVGLSQYNTGYFNLNTNIESGVTKIVNISLGVKGSSQGANVYPEVATITPLIPELVGSTVTPKNLGSILQYFGETDSNYTNGYFYKATGSIINVPDSASVTVTNRGDINVTVNISDLITALHNYTGWDVSYIKSRLVDAPYWQLRWDADNQMIDQNIYWDGYGTFSNTDVAACFTASSTSVYSGEIFLECNLSYVAGHEEVQNGAWEQINVQPGGGGLPPQTGNAGKFLTTDGMDASWSNKPLVNTSTANSTITINKTSTISLGTFAVALGDGAYVGNRDVAIGYTAGQSYTTDATSIGAYSHAPSGGIAIGSSANGTSNGAGTLTIGLRPNNTTINYKLLDADGTIPEARLADTTNATAGQVLTLDSNNNAVWQTPSTAVTTTATLAAADWSSNTQTITVNGVTSSNIVIVSPQPLSSGDYATAGVLCTAQNTNSLTFTCTQTPSNAINLSIVIIG